MRVLELGGLGKLNGHVLFLLQYMRTVCDFEGVLGLSICYLPLGLYMVKHIIIVIYTKLWSIFDVVNLWPETLF